MTYRANVVLHSKGPQGQELITVEAEYPRIVIAEAVTHRRNSDTWGYEGTVYCDRLTTPDMSKNSGSSRAIPFQRMLKKVMEDPYIPERFSRNGAGMQGHGWLEGEEHFRAMREWLNARELAAVQATLLHKIGVHKQDVNRLLEPFSWVTQVITATREGWNNFFNLRCHKDAHPAIQKMARLIYLRVRESRPQFLDWDYWHLPFVAEPYRWLVGSLTTTFRHEDFPLPIQTSAARCAWVSYENHNKDGSEEAVRATFARLVGQVPRHASPLEHQANPDDEQTLRELGRNGNLAGWFQARKLLRDEYLADYNPSDEEVASWGLL